MPRTPSTDDTVKSFKAHVNMSAAELRKWLDRGESKTVGQKETGGESTGHQAGRRLVEVLKTKRADYTDDDLRHMRKVTGYVKRHLAQRPDGDVSETRWRYSLINWGHDPLKDAR